jgi:hypothetical protein
MPTESLVLSVLQILVDAGSKIGEIADKNAHVFANKISNPTKDDHDEADTTMHKSAKGFFCYLFVFFLLCSTYIGFLLYVPIFFREYTYIYGIPQWKN